MARSKRIFYGPENHDKKDTEFSVEYTKSNLILIQIKDKDEVFSKYTVLDRDTAIKFSRELKKQISLIQ